MSEGLNTRMASEELYGVDGDGLGEGEVACEEDFELLGLHREQNPGHGERDGRVWGNRL